MGSRSHVLLWRTRGGAVLLGFIAVAAFHLLAGHTAHVFGAVPYLPLLACPLVNLFMHRGHGRHGEHQAGRPRPRGSPLCGLILADRPGTMGVAILMTRAAGAVRVEPAAPLVLVSR